MSNSVSLDILTDVPAPVTAEQLQAALDPIIRAYESRQATVEILFTSDERMQTLNKSHRNVDATTDVLSLPITFDSERGSVVPTSNQPLQLGTIVISVPQAIRQVGRFGDDLESELIGLAIHGLRHLLGHDHDESGEWNKPITDPSTDAH